MEVLGLIFVLAFIIATVVVDRIVVKRDSKPRASPRSRVELEALPRDWVRR